MGSVDARSGLWLYTRTNNTEQCFVASKRTFYPTQQRFGAGFRYTQSRTGKRSAHRSRTE